ncbi:methylenetetrahydrofolate reductase (NADPH) [Rhizobium sp. BK529]|uniref:methylenetetrahydrofolate reductase n=1 Tax=unclassified Rhizobium TaxID=2613769 RepID=UPI001044B1DF|nr:MULTISPECIES: methylenetetrahydrofolate reductase [unclassified Rhizobium]MBB3589706.1 methylenetetrahydrofolate reductase (NADPH) [Rhizobium sp. BK529]TCS04374.1 methylenetetrahydrofolate reductase (NADPH) [Rhizobium sp. BK418]
MALLNFAGKSRGHAPEPEFADMLAGWSIEIMPRTAAKIDDFRALLPIGTRVYIAHLDGTPIEDMVTTARRLNAQGFPVMPHIPARSIPDRSTLAEWLARYRSEANVRQALLLGGGRVTPIGDFHSSMQLIETGLFDHHGFTHLHFAGHPEGSRDVDPDGSTALADQALRWKQDFASRTDAKLALTTQFTFDAQPVIDWAERIQEAGVTMPIHIGIAGPAKLQTLIKYAISCGIGPSMKVLHKRAMDISKLLLPYEPTDLVAALADHKARKPESLISRLHIFPLGGIQVAADWMNKHRSVETPIALP